MEYLVTMTTNVPDGTPQEAIAEIRERESRRSRELAAAGSLLRLWRPPLQPEEWRTLGLFAAESLGELEIVLASMPLRVWRTDAVTPLLPHPNDPSMSQHDGGAPVREFLTTFTITVPANTPDEAIADMNAREARRASELADQGRLARLWRLEEIPTTMRSLGLWRTQDGSEMQAILESLPMHSWIHAETTPLTPHPSDPAVINPGPLVQRTANRAPL
jgi:muconolactone delta-isomerase